SSQPKTLPNSRRAPLSAPELCSSRQPATLVRYTFRGMQTIQRVAVLGAGTMGSRIAAHFANAGTPSLLLDIAAPGEDRNAVAKRGLENALKQRPSAFFTDANAALVEVDRKSVV